MTSVAPDWTPGHIEGRRCCRTGCVPRRRCQRRLFGSLGLARGRRVGSEMPAVRCRNAL